jgi:hypothetical protein
LWTCDLNPNREIEWADLQGRSINGRHLSASDKHIVDKSSIGAAEILDVDLTIAHQNSTMLLTDGLTGRPEVTLCISADQELKSCDRYNLAFMRSRSDNQADLHMCSRRKCCRRPN